MHLWIPPGILLWISSEIPTGISLLIFPQFLFMDFFRHFSVRFLQWYSSGFFQECIHWICWLLIRDSFEDLPQGFFRYFPGILLLIILRFRIVRVSSCDSFSDFFRNSFRDSFIDFSLDFYWNSSRYSFQNLFRDSYGDLSWILSEIPSIFFPMVRDPYTYSSKDSFRDFFRDSFWDSFRDSSRDFFRDSSRDFSLVSYIFFLGSPPEIPSIIASGISPKIPSGLLSGFLQRSVSGYSKGLLLSFFK